VREIHGWSRRLGWLVVFLTLLILGAGAATAAAPKKFTLITVVLDGTKIWLSSSLMVHQGDEVELTLINKLEDPHGFKIEDVGIEEVVQPQAHMTVRFTASQPGVHSYICHLHPPHIGGRPAFRLEQVGPCWHPRISLGLAQAGVRAPLGPEHPVCTARAA
jgi:plastocyanin